MRRLLFGLAVLISGVFPNASKASHIVGGEIIYEYLGNNLYDITLVLYRDCSPNSAPYFDFANVTAFDTSDTRVYDFDLGRPTIGSVPLWVNDTCAQLDKTVCYQYAIYNRQYTLPPIPGGYKLAYDLCCWNYSVTNIVNVDGVYEQGLTVTAYIPDSSVAKVNNNPVFNKKTPPFICLGQELKFDHSATDADGDSLVYELFTPYNSTGPNDSRGFPINFPKELLVYKAPYDLNNIMGGVPLIVDAKTGLLTAIPNTIGQFVFGVRVNEYRNDIWIGSTERSYQFNVKPCTDITEAILDDLTKCGDTVVEFSNESYGYSHVYWHFGDLASSDSTSTDASPSHVFSGTGNYKITLIAYSVNGDDCNDTTSADLTLLPAYIGDFFWQEEECSNLVQFNDLSPDTYGQVKNWLWNFGDGELSVKQNPKHLYNLTVIPKTFEVQLIVQNEYDCIDTVTRYYTGTDKIYEIEEINASKNFIYPRHDSALLTVNAKNAVSYEWTPKSGLSNPNSSATYAKPGESIKYTVKVTDSRGCVDETSISLGVYPYVCGEKEVFVPNAFSPNGDGENDFLRIRGEEIIELDFSVYNRWGELVYHSENKGMLKDESLGWNGKFKGTMQSPGVFVYFLKARCSDEHEFTKKGNITLIR